ncbi:MAG: 30S ribosomal protein S3 [Parcubacteria group bacterium LiPW_39]|nr:MAG: 30S ribosomal protein S3 [Parcubacteria group bacterium LiPW_39]
MLNFAAKIGMGQKVHPVAFRLGMTHNWKSRWFNKAKYQQFLKEDFIIRSFLIKKLAKSGLDKVEIERFINSVNVIIHAARPGLIIGRGGSGIEDLRGEIKRLLHKKLGTPLKIDLRLSIEEVKQPESRAAIAAQALVEQIEKRIRFRRVMKQGLEKITQSKDVQGAKIMIKGRLDGNEIARREWLRKGSIPLHTMRANIDYAQATAFTTYGTVGVKVWVYKKDTKETNTH